MIISTDNKMKRGMPTINDHMAKLNSPMKNSSISSAIAMMRMKIITLINPKKDLTVCHICSVS